MYKPPLVQFEPLAQCEVNAIAQYYASVSAAPCIALSGIASWKCRSLAGKGRLTRRSTALLCSYSPPRACPQRQTHSRLGEPLL